MADKEVKKSVDTKKKSTIVRSGKKVKAVTPRFVHEPVNGFIAFLREQAVVGLAIGLVIGTQAKEIVNALTTSFINPVVGLITPGNGNLAGKQFIVHHGKKIAVFGWGAFVISLINFIIVAGVVYFVIKGLRLDKLDKKAE